MSQYIIFSDGSVRAEAQVGAYAYMILRDGEPMVRHAAPSRRLESSSAGPETTAQLEALRWLDAHGVEPGDTVITITDNAHTYRLMTEVESVKAIRKLIEKLGADVLHQTSEWSEHYRWCHDAAGALTWQIEQIKQAEDALLSGS